MKFFFAGLGTSTTYAVALTCATGRIILYNAELEVPHAPQRPGNIDLDRRIINLQPTNRGRSSPEDVEAVSGWGTLTQISNTLHHWTLAQTGSEPMDIWGWHSEHQWVAATQMPGWSLGSHYKDASLILGLLGRADEPNSSDDVLLRAIWVERIVMAALPEIERALLLSTLIKRVVQVQ